MLHELFFALVVLEKCIVHTGEIWEVCHDLIPECVCNESRLCPWHGINPACIQDGMYKPVIMERNIDVRKCTCATVTKIPLCCITEYGMFLKRGHFPKKDKLHLPI